MIKKWKIEPSPTKRDPLRHSLALFCDMKDVLDLVKKFGPIFSRPEKISGEYSYLIHVMKSDKKIIDEIDNFLSLNAKKQNDGSEDKEVALERKQENKLNLPDIDIEKISAIETEKEKIELKKEEIKLEDEKNVKKSEKDKAAIKEEISKVKSDENLKEPVKDKMKGEAKKSNTNRSFNTNSKIKWSVELPLNPTLNFSTLIAGPHNRFAHAAAMAVVENPGVMYNPILIFGPQGVGKSHLIHSIGYALSSSLGHGNVFVSNAVKLSRGIDLSIEGGNISDLEKRIESAKVIIVDDIDLLVINDKNKQYLSKFFNNFLSSNKQIVISSIFQPKSLEQIENAIGFQFTQGWMVDIKIPNPQTYRIILNQLLNSLDIKLSDEEIKTILMSKMMDFKTMMKTLTYAKKIEKYFKDSSLMAKDYLSMILGETGEDKTAPNEAELNSADSFNMSDSDSKFRWGLYYPKDMLKQSKYFLSKLKEIASSKLSMDLKWEQIFIKEYDPDEVYGIPFKIGDFASKQNINGLILLSPQPTSALGAKQQEFRNLTEKILESYGIKTAWAESDSLKSVSNYLRVLMELL